MSIESLQQISEAIGADPMNKDLYLQRGIIWFDLKCNDESISDLMLYESLGGSNSEYIKYLGMALSRTASKRSTEYLKKYVELNPEDRDIIVYLAETYFQNGDYDLSATFYNKAISLGYDPSILNVKAQSLAESGDRKNAALFNSEFGKKKGFFKR